MRSNIETKRYQYEAHLFITFETIITKVSFYYIYYYYEASLLLLAGYMYYEVPLFNSADFLLITFVLITLHTNETCEGDDGVVFSARLLALVQEYLRTQHLPS